MCQGPDTRKTKQLWPEFQKGIRDTARHAVTRQKLLSHFIDEETEVQGVIALHRVSKQGRARAGTLSPCQLPLWVTGCTHATSQVSVFLEPKRGARQQVATEKGCQRLGAHLGLSVHRHPHQVCENSKECTCEREGPSVPRV